MLVKMSLLLSVFCNVVAVLLLLVAGVGGQETTQPRSVKGSTSSLLQPTPSMVMPLVATETPEFLLLLPTSQPDMASSVELFPFLLSDIMEFLEPTSSSLVPERSLSSKQTPSLIPVPEQSPFVPEQTSFFILEPDQTSSFILVPDQSSSSILIPDQSSIFMLVPEQSSSFTLEPDQSIPSSGTAASSVSAVPSSTSQLQVDTTFSDTFFQQESASDELIFAETVMIQSSAPTANLLPDVFTTEAILMPPEPSPTATSTLPPGILTTELILLPPDSTLDFILFPSATPTATPSMTSRTSLPPALLPTPTSSNVEFLRPFLSSELNQLPLSTMFPSTPSLLPSLPSPSPSSPFTTDFPPIIQPSTPSPELDVTLDFSPIFSLESSVLGGSEVVSLLIPDVITPTPVSEQSTVAPPIDIVPPTSPITDTFPSTPGDVVTPTLATQSVTQDFILFTATPEDFFIFSTSQMQPFLLETLTNTATPPATEDPFFTSTSQMLLLETSTISTPSITEDTSPMQSLPAETPIPLATDDFFIVSSVETQPLLLPTATSFTLPSVMLPSPSLPPSAIPLGSSPGDTPIFSSQAIIPIITSDDIDMLVPMLTSALLEPLSVSLSESAATPPVPVSMTTPGVVTPSEATPPVSMAPSPPLGTTTIFLLEPEESTVVVELLSPSEVATSSLVLSSLSPSQLTSQLTTPILEPIPSSTSIPEETSMLLLFESTVPSVLETTIGELSLFPSVDFDLSSAVLLISATSQPDFFLMPSVSATPPPLTTSATPLPSATPPPSATPLPSILAPLETPTFSSALPPPLSPSTPPFSPSQVTPTLSADIRTIQSPTLPTQTLTRSPDPTGVSVVVPESTSLESLIPELTSVEGLIPGSTSVEGLVPESTSVGDLVPEPTSVLVLESTSVESLVLASTSFAPESTSMVLVPESTSMVLVPESTSVDGLVSESSSLIPESTSVDVLVPESTSMATLVPVSTGTTEGSVTISTTIFGVSVTSTVPSVGVPPLFTGSSVASDIVASSPTSFPVASDIFSPTSFPVITRTPIVSDIVAPSTTTTSLILEPSIPSIVTPSLASSISAMTTSSVIGPPSISSTFTSSLPPSPTDPEIGTTSEIPATPTMAPLTFPVSSGDSTTPVITPTSATFDLLSSRSVLATATLVVPLTTPTLPPSPLACPSFSTPNTVIEPSHQVNIGLALTPSEHASLATPNLQKRCDLEAALVGVFMRGLMAQARIAKRQAGTANYDVDISVVGELSQGFSLIMFYVLNGTDMTSAPVPVPALVVAMAIGAANVQQVDSYPIIVPATPIETTPTTAVTNFVPMGTDSLLIPIVAAVGGAMILLMFVIIFIICCFAICYRKKGIYDVQAMQTIEGGRTYAESRDFASSTRQNSVAVQHDAPTLAKAKGERGVTISHLAWADGEGSSHDRPASNEIQVPPGLFERVIHYDDTSPPPVGSSPSIRGLRMRLRTSSIAPSPSTSNKSGESVPTPAALRPPSRPSAREVEAKNLREEALRLQEQQEEKELKLRRRATLERLLQQSHERDPFTRSRASHRRSSHRRRKKKRGTVAPLGGEDEPRPSTHRRHDWSLGQPEMDIETPPMATPTSDLPASTRHRVRKKSNRIAPLSHMTDGYDSTDHRTKPPTSQQSSRRFKRGRSQRGRPFTQQNLVIGGGRDSRGVAHDAHKELAWLDTGGGGVQLMRFNPIATPTYTLPPHPSTAQQVIQVQPRPQEVQPHPQEVQSLAQEKLPTLQSLQSQSFSQKQLETYFRIHQEMEKLHLHHSTPAPPKTEATPTQAVRTTPTPEAGWTRPGKVDEPRPEGAGPPPDPTHIPAAPAHIPMEGPLDNSYSSTIHDFMQQNTSGRTGRGLEGRLLNRESFIESPQQQYFTPAGGWHPVSGRVITPYQLHAPPPSATQPPYTPAPGQLLWAPTEPHPMAPPTDHMMLSPAQLTQLRHNQDYSNHGYPEQRYSPPYHLPSHSQIRRHRDPFQ